MPPRAADPVKPVSSHQSEKPPESLSSNEKMDFLVKRIDELERSLNDKNKKIDTLTKVSGSDKRHLTRNEQIMPKREPIITRRYSF